MTNLFAYGTLMCDDIMQAVSGCRLQAEPGSLKGYGRWSVKGEHYPAIVAEPESRVEGLVYLNVPQTAWLRLDQFEGEMYQRLSLEVALGDGRPVAAEAYVIQPAFLHCLDRPGWSFEQFMADGKSRFQEQYKGYERM